MPIWLKTNSDSSPRKIHLPESSRQEQEWDCTSYTPQRAKFSLIGDNLLGLENLQFHTFLVLCPRGYTTPQHFFLKKLMVQMKFPCMILEGVIGLVSGSRGCDSCLFFSCTLSSLGNSMENCFSNIDLEDKQRNRTGQGIKGHGVMILFSHPKSLSKAILQHRNGSKASFFVKIGATFLLPHFWVLSVVVLLFGFR